MRYASTEGVAVGSLLGSAFPLTGLSQSHFGLRNERGATAKRREHEV